MAKRGRKPKNITVLAEKNTSPVPKKERSKPKIEKNLHSSVPIKENLASSTPSTPLEENEIDEMLLPVPTQQVDFPYLFTLKVDNTHVFHDQQTSFQVNDVFGLKIENIEKSHSSKDLTLWFSLVRLAS